MAMMSCPFCAEQIQAVATKCRYCGEALAERPGATAVAAGDAEQAYDVGKVIGWMFRDPEWVSKLLICIACFIGGVVIIPSFAYMGYKLRIARQQWANPGEEPMPGWDDFWSLVGDGFKLFVTFCLVGILVAMIFGVCLGGIIAMAAATGGKGAAGPLVGLGVLVFYAGVLIGSVAFQYFLPAIEMEYLETGEVTSGLHFGAIWRRISTNAIDYLLLFIYSYLLQLIGALGMFACYIGMFFTLPWAGVSQGCLIGRYLAKRDHDAAVRGA